MHKLAQINGPAIYASFRVGETSRVMKGSIEPFTLRIALGVMWCCASFLDPIQLAEVRNHSAFKIPALIRM